MSKDPKNTSTPTNRGYQPRQDGPRVGHQPGTSQKPPSPPNKDSGGSKK